MVAGLDQDEQPSEFAAERVPSGMAEKDGPVTGASLRSHVGIQAR
jgi:hypothetical protein